MSTQPAQPIDQLPIALDATQRVIAGVRNDQWNQPSPCTEWTVRQVVSHVVGGNHLFASILRGDSPPVRPETTAADSELVTAFQDSATTLLEAFRQPGVLERVFSVPFGTVPGRVALNLRITELLVHGWDIARATGQAASFPEHLAEQQLAFSRGTLDQIPADRSPFAPPQPVADDAPAIDRLAALLGRSVAAHAPASNQA